MCPPPIPEPPLEALAMTAEFSIVRFPTVELQRTPELPPIPHPEDELLAVTVEFEISISPTVDVPNSIRPPPIPEPCVDLAVTVEFPITIRPTLESIATAVEELKPDPIPDPPFAPAELFAITNEFKISKPEIREDP
jgi:hypothetical protein